MIHYINELFILIIIFPLRDLNKGKKPKYNDK